MSMTSAPPRELRFAQRPLAAATRAWLRWLKDSPVGWEAIVVYTVLAVLFGRHTLAHLDSACSCLNISDAWEATWPFEWFPYALIHGLNPWYTHFQWNPPGLNTAGITSFPLVAIIFAPVTWIWGPIVSTNVATLGALVLTAWATYQLCRYVSKDRAAALVGGATVGFGTYVLLQTLAGHLLLTVIVAPQFAALAVLRYLDGAIGRRRVTVELTLVLICQLFISSEIFATMTLFGAVLLLLGYAFGTAEIRRGIKNLIVPLAIAYGVTLLLSADYLYWLIKAPKYAVGIGNGWHTDALAYVVPTNLTWIGGATFWPVYQMIAQTGIEDDAYLGLPLILITLRWICTRWHLRLSKFLAAAGAIGILWTLGPTLHVAGKPTIWLPYRLLSGLPIFNEILESRTAVYTELLVAVILTLWLADRRRRLAVKWVAAVVAALFVFPNLVYINQAYTSTRPIPTFFATDMYRSYIKRGATVFPIPWGFYSPDLMWQADDGMYYRLASGYFVPSPTVRWQGNQTLNDLWADKPRPRDARGLRSILIARHVDDVVVTPADFVKWAKILRSAGLTHPIRVGGIDLYRGPWRASGARSGQQPVSAARPSPS